MHADDRPPRAGRGWSLGRRTPPRPAGGSAPPRPACPFSGASGRPSRPLIRPIRHRRRSRTARRGRPGAAGCARGRPRRDLRAAPRSRPGGRRRPAGQRRGRWSTPPPDLMWCAATQGSTASSRSVGVEHPLVVQGACDQLSETDAFAVRRVLGEVTGAFTQRGDLRVRGDDLREHDGLVVGRPQVVLRAAGQLVEDHREVLDVGTEQVLDDALRVGHAPSRTGPARRGPDATSLSRTSLCATRSARRPGGRSSADHPRPRPPPDRARPSARRHRRRRPGPRGPGRRRHGPRRTRSSRSPGLRVNCSDSLSRPWRPQSRVLGPAATRGRLLGRPAAAVVIVVACCHR